MLAMTIKADPRALLPGDFGALVTDSMLHLPETFVQVLTDQGVRTAADAVSYVHTFPSYIAEALHWNLADVDHGLAALCDQLEGMVDDDILHPSQQPPLFYGALDPNTLPPCFKK